MNGNNKIPELFCPEGKGGKNDFFIRRSLAMCNMALTTLTINMQNHYEDSSDMDEFGYPSDAEWQRNASSPLREGDMEGLDELGLRPSLFELNSDRAICPKDKIYYHTGTSNAPVRMPSA